MSQKNEIYNLTFTCKLFGTAEIKAKNSNVAKEKLRYAISKELKNLFLYRSNTNFLIENHKNLKIEEVK